MYSILRYLVGIPLWAGLLYGTLNLHSADLGLGHGICGAWGCGPPTEALLGFHGFSLLLIVPMAVLLGLYLSDDVRRKLGKILFWGALGAVLLYILKDGIEYFQRAKATEHLVQRALFCVATAVDLPMLQFALAGLILHVWPRRSREPVAVSPEAPLTPL